MISIRRRLKSSIWKKDIQDANNVLELLVNYE